MNHPLRTARASRRSSSLGSLVVAVAAFGAGSVIAADDARAQSAAARYEIERAMCLRGQTGQDLKTCLREAAAASAQARRQGTDGGTTQAELEANRLERCERLPDDDRKDCIARMQGQGTTSGSVEGGGIYRELVTTSPASR